MIAPLFLAFSLLTQGALASACKQILDGPHAAVQQCGALKVVKLRGAPVQRARAMGSLLQGPLSTEVVRYFSQKVDELVREEAGPLGGAFSLAYNQVVRLFHRATPRGLAEEIDAMALGMGIDPIVLRRGLSLPDTAVLLQGLGSLPHLGFLPAAGCTSVASSSSNGVFVYGRNLDFAGVGTFDRNPMLLSIEPEPGSQELRHLVIGADGLLFGGITGVNEAGIVFAIHQNFSRDVGVHGVPMILIGELILRSARTLEDAEEIIRRHRPAGLWTFVVTDLNRGEVLAVEASQRHFLSRRSEGGLFAQTNHGMHAESLAHENADLGIHANSVYRIKRAFEMMEESGARDPALIARILSYQEDKNGKFSGYRDVLKGETIQTAIFEARPGSPKMLYLSVGEAPASGGPYAAIPFEDFWKNDQQPAIEEVDLAKTGIARRVSQREIALAFHTYFDKRRPLEAASILADHPTLATGLFTALAHYQAGRWQEAVHLAEKALRDPRFISEPAYIHQSLETVKLASFLRLGKKEEARNLAEKLLEKGPAKNPLKRLCTLVLQGKKPPAWMLNLTFNFFSGDLGGRND